MSARQLSLFPHLRVSPSILARLGEELNPNPDHGLLELVKNAYDADARRCTIELIDTHQPGGEVRITDNGDGMDDGQIEEDWLILGSSRKSVEKPTRLGRLPVGSKGLGRLAALRLGERCLLTTRPKTQPRNEYRLEIDWNEFDEVRTVEEVELDIAKGRRAARKRSGTEIRLQDLRAQITRIDVKRLARRILLLADPFDDSPTGFSPELKTPEFQDLERLVKRRYFDDAEFHLVAKLDDRGQATASVKDYRGNVLFSAEHSDLSPKTPERLYDSPAAHLDIWAFILNKKTFGSRSTTVGEVKEWLGHFGGVHLYIRGVRVAPYGDPGHDWLEMNLKRVRSPELRPSTNTSIGRIALDDPKKQLLEKTDRTGLIEGHAFSELKRFATDALDWMARKRLEEREQRRSQERASAPRKTKASKQKVEKAIADLPRRAQEDVKVAFERYDRAREKEASALQKEVQLYRTLSTVGITAAVFAHESTNPIQLIVRNTKQVKKKGQEEFRKRYPEVLGKPVERILRQASTLQAFSGLTLSQIDHEKRRATSVKVHKTIKQVLDTFSHIIAGRKVNATPQFDEGNPFLRASEAAIESILTNLLTNSLRVLGQGAQRSPQVVVRTEITEGLLILRVLDNGPGIQGLSMKDIWLPGETTYPNGTGLGLTIVRDTVKDLGGVVDAIQTGELGGAEIIVELPILGA